MINAGKSRYNEDQAAVYQGELSRGRGFKPVKYLYVAVFDGHGGPGAAVKAMKEMHEIVREGLDDVRDYLISGIYSFVM